MQLLFYLFEFTHKKSLFFIGLVLAKIAKFKAALVRISVEIGLIGSRQLLHMSQISLQCRIAVDELSVRCSQLFDLI